TCGGDRAGVRTTDGRSRGGSVGTGVGVAATTTGGGVGVALTTTGSGVAGGGVVGIGVATATTGAGVGVGRRFFCQTKAAAAAPRATTITKIHTTARPLSLRRREPRWVVTDVFDSVFMGVLPFGLEWIRLDEPLRGFYAVRM